MLYKIWRIILLKKIMKRKINVRRKENWKALPTAIATSVTYYLLHNFHSFINNQKYWIIIF